MIRKTLSFMGLYAARMSAEHPNFNYTTMMNLTATEFYHYSGLTYHQLGNDVFSSVYGDV